MSNALNIGDVSLPGDGYPSIFGFSIPVLDGLEGAYLFADGAAQISRNYAPGKPDAKIIGSPVAEATCVNFNDAAYLNTGIAEVADMTLVAVCRDNSDLKILPGFIGNNLSIAAGGIAISTYSATQLRGTNVKPSGTVESIGLAADAAQFAAVAYRPKSSAQSLMTNLGTGVTATGASSAARVVDAANPIWIGRIPSNAFKGPNKAVLALVYSRAVTDAELVKITAWVKEYCTSKGVTI